MKNWSNYFDDLGIIRNSDTGDSAREMGTYLTVTNSLSTLDALSKCFNPIKKEWVRHPQPTDSWHKDPKEFSRDQWIGVMCGLINHKDLTTAKILILDTFLAQLKHPFTAQNKDIITWEWALYSRALNLWYLWPLLLILDWGLVINVIIRSVKSYLDYNDTGDDINVTSMCIISSQNLWTPVVWLARKFYKFHKYGPQRSFNEYYKRLEAPPMDELYYPAIKKYF
jgi:hypothetical protein